ncbi:hypothetical protein COJ87_29730 [Bacillus cereus]|nr:hypothetical protein COM76_03515 [Bacillus cereus]PGA33080.1 hypothetical protein COL88_31300 [Bacillus thuringiensis]PET56889.1 hypothetical protein CN522_28835 [Bacillus cereus]PEU63374.1 hypothetical protein CN414_00600 [Bacillus cereus]PEX72137.1 hypothetical protein CN457_29085 [Bacillus cereus]
MFALYLTLGMEGIYMVFRNQITWLQALIVIFVSTFITISITLVRDLGNENIIKWYNFDILLYSCIVAFLFLYKVSYCYLRDEWDVFALLRWRSYVLFILAITLQFLISNWLLNIPLLSTWDLLTSPTAYYLDATGAQKVSFIIGMTLLAAIAEEAIFRGIILKKLLTRFNLFISVCLSSLFFSIVHLPSTFTDAFLFFLLGVLTASLYRLTRSLSISIIFHSTWNLFIIFYSNYL